MQKKQSFVIKGMNRDISASKLSSEYAYEIKNMRIFPTTENTLMSMVNERGNKLLKFYDWDDKNEEKISDIQTTLDGTPIGQAIINDVLVLFLTEVDGELPDVIDKFWFNNDGELLRIRLYKGDLGFKIGHPIETIVYYENEKLQKVYWTDGINQPRMINIAAEEEVRDGWRNTSFDFVRTLSLKETVSIHKNDITGGLFAPGALQYVFTYFDKYGQETNPFYISTLFYTSYIDRGGSPEDSISNSFDIEIHNIQGDPKFDYVRIYSILRTSINATPECKKVADLAPVENSDGTYSISYTDTGTTGESIDPTELLYVGGQEVTFGTMTQKDNTLFLASIELQQHQIKDLEINSLFLDINNNLHFTQDSAYAQEKVLEFSEPTGYYTYDHQLKYSSTQIKTFKYLETYRFGLIFQHKSGAWSEVIWLKDLKNDLPIKDTFYSNSPIDLTYVISSITLSTNGNEDEQNKEFLNRLLENGFIRVKPVIVYPDLNDRSCICQGVLCPTMYNLSDRYSNTPFVQSSWFTRPNAPFDYDENYHLTQGTIGDNNAKGDGRDKPNDNADWKALDGSEEESMYSPAGILLNGYYKNTPKATLIDVVNKGTWAEFRHNYPIPNCINRRAEIQCIVNPPAPKDLVQDNETSEVNVTTWVNDHSENYYIDQSIITLHSPEIEFDDQLQSFDTTGLKLRIIGVVPITATASDIDIQTSTPASQYHEDYSGTDSGRWEDQTDIIWSAERAIGFYKEVLGAENSFYTSSSMMGTSHFGWKGLSSGVFWFDEVSHSSRKNTEHYTTSFVIYPWHRNGSLNNGPGIDENGYRESMLEIKRISNLRFSYKTQYFSKGYMWNAEEKDSDINTGISGVKIFNSDEVILTKLPAPSSTSQDLNYYGNIDKLLTTVPSEANNEDETDTYEDTASGENRRISRGYPIVVTGRSTLSEQDEEGGEEELSDTYHSMFRNKYCTLFKIDGNGCKHGQTNRYLNTAYCYGTDPIRIKYKSTPHAVMALNYTADGIQRVLPNIENINSSSLVTSSDKHFYWDKDNNKYGVSQDIISNPENEYSYFPKEIPGVDGIQYGWLWLGELYRDDDQIANRFGGDTEEALEQNTWVACGESVSLEDPIEWTDELGKHTGILIKWTEGDTYYQRYDHIKTYPFTLEDQNSVTDIISFMCETRINLDGRYDRNRGQLSNLAITPENFNQVNTVYSQENNFFTYHTLNKDLINLDNFHNSLTWTKTKIAGDLVDTWTNITLASTLDLDGDKGSIRALERFNNQILAFQDTGIAQIKYNENVQLATTEGVPVELANSGKVDGKDYLTNQIGCTNKWSIRETPNGLYFIDNLTKAMYNFNGQFTNLTDNNGFSSWITNELQDTSDWNPVDFEDFITYYDRINNDVLLINKDNCLALSETLGTFSSFYDYENTPYMANIGNRFLAIRKNDSDGFYSMWLQQEGDYNVFFGNHKPFWLTIIANDGMVTDKTFDNVEFRADTFKDDAYQSDETFDYLEARNEYQYGHVPLFDSKGHPAWIKKKFKIWRANIPRSTENRRDRIRSPWAYITLKKQSEDENKTILHDVQVVYYDNTPMGMQVQQQESQR